MDRRWFPGFLMGFLMLVVSLGLTATGAPEPSPDSPGELPERMSALASTPELLLLKSGALDPTEGVPPESFFGRSEARDRDEGILHYLVQFPCVPGDPERKVLSDAGAEILHYVPNNAYLIRMDSSRFGEVAYAPEVRAAFRLPKFAKVDPALLTGGKDVVQLELVCTHGASAEPAAGRIAKQFTGVRFLSNAYHHKGGRVICAVLADQLEAFLETVSGFEEVLSIVPWEEKILSNDNSIWVIQNYDTTNTTNYALSATLWNHGITGTGQIACVNDSGARNDSCFFRYNGTAGSEATAQSLTPPATGTVDLAKKTVAYYVEPGAAAYDTSSAQYHGTHTCGSVLGDNYATLSTPTSGGHDSGDGMAPNAKLVMQDVGDAAGGLSGLAGDLNNMFLQAYNAGARIHSDSWGTTASNYDSTAMDMDEFSYRYEDFLFVVAMGNSGNSPGDGSIGAPATAKDVVSVMATTNGSSSSANNLSSYSRGPVDDGRRKPDVCTPGMGINSTNGGAACGTQSMSGTSMATPTTSGGLVLMRQYFTDGWYPTGTKTAADARNPSGALLKACLVNGAMPVTGTDPLGTLTTIPSMDQGWGRTHLENALYFSGDARRTRLWDVWNANGMTTGQQVEYTINVTANTQPLKVHLVWTDPESTTLASVNLVNNLDLEVVSPTGTTYRGNVFSSGQSTTGGTADVLNNVEGFVLNSPATGTWTLRVKATAVPGTGTAPYSNRQGYALVATWATCTSTVTAPSGLTATNNPPGIDLSWGAVGGATGYVIYKARGASPAATDYTVLAQVTGMAFSDTKVQGGYTYWYKVRATDGCGESPASTAVSATYSGNCTLLPTFGGVTSVTNDTASTVCDLLLTWTAATSNCPLGNTVTYNIYRSTTPYFTPGAGNLLAHGVAGTSYRDYAVNALTTYYYIVRAEDGTSLNGGPHNGGNEDTNTAMVMGTPWSSTTTPGTFADDGGDTNAKLTLAWPWRVTNLQNHTTGGGFSYHNAVDGNTYPAGVCTAATTPPLPLTAGATLTYWARYDIEYQWDGLVVEISTNGGGAWTVLTPTGGYPTTLSQTQGNACNYPSTQGAFSGPATNGTLTAWTQYTHDLSAYAGQTALVRWNFSADGGAEFAGFYLDDIQLTNAATFDGCATRDGQVSLDRTAYGCAGHTITIQLADNDLQGSGTHNVTIASGAEPGGETVTLTETPANSGAFTGTILTTTAAPPSAGQLSVAHGNTITVTYIDADDGHGGTNVPKTDTATADCQGPVISNVQAINVTATSATITWTTSENANSRVTYGTATPPGTNRDDLATYVTSHSVPLTGLTECTTYYFSVTSADAAGNSATDANSGAYYTFQTLQNTAPTYASTDVPKAITDNTTATSTISVPDTKTIQDVNVLINATHTYDGDVQFRLVGPDSTTVALVTNRGAAGDNFTNTVLDDEAATAISAGAAPFTGSFRPESPLTAFDGKSAAGTWTLQVQDTGAGDTGSLTGWSLIFTYPASACGPHGTYQSSAAVSDDCPAGGAGDGNGFFEPGETVQFSVTLLNDGTVPLTGLSATVTPVTAGVAMTDATATYADIAAGSTGTSQAPHFTAVIPSTHACNTPVEFSVSITSAQGTWSGGTFSFAVGSPGGPQTTTTPSTDVPKAVPDPGTVESNVVITATGNLSDVNVTITSLTHTWDADLDIYLVHPDNTVVELSTDNGGSSNNYTNTVFDDAAATAITAGAAPFTGTFRPEGSLAALNGKPANGTWKLRVTDDTSSDSGSLVSWSLTVSVPGTPVCNVCTVACTTPSSPAITGITDVSGCAQSGVQVAYTAGAPATRHDLYRDGVSVVTGYASGATYNPGDTASHNYTVRTYNESCFADSTAVAGTDANGTPGTPAITGFTDLDACTGSGVQIAFNSGSGATRHDLYRDGSLAVTGYTSGATYTPGDTASHSYVVRAVNGTCTTDSGTQAGADAANAPPAVSNLRVTKSGADMTIAWDLLVVAPTRYEVWRGLAPNGPFDVKVGETTGLVDGITVSLAGQPATAYYLVRAVNGSCLGTLN